MKEQSLVGGLAGVDPLVVDVDGLREEVDGGLEVLHAHVALDPARVLGLLHLDLAALLVVAVGAVEHDVQGLDRLALGAGTALGLPAAHDEGLAEVGGRVGGVAFVERSRRKFCQQLLQSRNGNARQIRSYFQSRIILIFASSSLEKIRDKEMQCLG